MYKKEAWRAAFATASSAMGLCFVSARTVAMFFSQTGGASWLGVAMASVLYGALCAGIAAMATSTGGESFAAVCARCAGAAFGRIAGLVHAGLMVMLLAAMLHSTGRLAMLALPFENAYWMGTAALMCTALCLCMRNGRGISDFGMCTAGSTAAFFAGQALDTREIRIYRSCETVAELDGSYAAAIVLAAVFASLCALAGADMAAKSARNGGRPIGFGLRCGCILAILLTVSNAAMLRGGERLLSQALPVVVLSARWGTAGYYACILIMYLCAAATVGGIMAGWTGGSPKHDKIT